MIQNPILRGFCPDPSIVRANGDYYIATSTFEWWPAVRIFHSTDLSHWEQLSSPICRQSQADLRGDPNSGGIWAPCLSWDGHEFYLVYTDVKTKKGLWYNTHNYVIHAPAITGPWSEPVYLNSIGFDPSLFHDTDGKKYLVNMVNGFHGVLVQEYDAEHGCLVGERRKVYAGSGIGCTEGPHLYHIGSWYYLIVAEGGTGYSHCVTMARAKTVWGPYETAPENPILTSDRDNPAALQKCGHADIVSTPQGEWYMVHLCSRPLAGAERCVLGRETAIQKMEWADGWLRLAGGGRFARLGADEPTGAPSHPLAELPPEDTFDEHTLRVDYASPRAPLGRRATLAERLGWLRLYGYESLNSLHEVTLAARRQQQPEAHAAAVMEFAPCCPEQLAGLAYYYDAMNFYLLAKTVTDSGMAVLTLLRSDTGVIEPLTEPVPVSDGALVLAADTDASGAQVQFSYRQDGISHKVGGPQTTEILTDEHCRGFTGAHFGLYAHDMAGLGSYADFDTFTLRFGAVPKAEET